jgi:hypothetical protein
MKATRRVMPDTNPPEMMTAAHGCKRISFESGTVLSIRTTPLSVVDLLN